MSMTPERFFIRPLVYDAMSGEFAPPTDPEKRLHTLGRLALATVTKGKYTLDRESFDPLFTYRPSWAPDVTAQVRINYLPMHVTGEYLATPMLAITSLDLTSESGKGLHVSDETGDDGVTLYIDDSEAPNDVIYYDLALGTRLRDAKATVTNAAERLFSTQS